MAITLVELQEKLKQIDEITLLEKLNISSEEIVERFVDVIEEKFDELEIELEDEDVE